MNWCLSLWLGEFPEVVPERGLCSSFSEVYVSDRMRDFFSLPVEAWASHFSVRAKNRLCGLDGMGWDWLDGWSS